MCSASTNTSLNSGGGTAAHSRSASATSRWLRSLLHLQARDLSSQIEQLRATQVVSAGSIKLRRSAPSACRSPVAAVAASKPSVACWTDNCAALGLSCAALGNRLDAWSVEQAVAARADRTSISHFAEEDALLGRSVRPRALPPRQVGPSPTGSRSGSAAQRHAKEAKAGTTQEVHSRARLEGSARGDTSESPPPKAGY